MVNKKFLLVIPVMALVLGITFVGCNDDSLANDPALIGTWAREDEFNEFIKFDGSNIEVSIDDISFAKGTYTANAGIITFTYTQVKCLAVIDGEIRGNKFKWYSKNEKSELINAYLEIDSDMYEVAEAIVENMFTPHVVAYSVNGNTLSFEGEYYYKK